MLMLKDLGMTFFGSGEAKFSSSLIAKDLRQPQGLWKKAEC
jgi:hypothetical protein